MYEFQCVGNVSSHVGRKRREPIFLGSPAHNFSAFWKVSSCASCQRRADFSSQTCVDVCTFYCCFSMVKYFLPGTLLGVKDEPIFLHSPTNFSDLKCVFVCLVPKTSQRVHTHDRWSVWSVWSITTTVHDLDLSGQIDPWSVSVSYTHLTLPTIYSV